MMTLYTKVGRRYEAASEQAICAAAREIAEQSLRVKRPELSSPRAARDLLILQFAGLEHEVFGAIYLDNRHRAIAFEVLFRGTIDGCSVHPREVVKAVLRHNAAAVIFAHNHPSGLTEPSHADELITARLRDALALIDVRVLDHLIVGGTQTTSFAERGLI
jgi:DNA repair protein RadC